MLSSIKTIYNILLHVILHVILDYTSILFYDVLLVLFSDKFISGETIHRMRRRQGKVTKKS